MIRSDDDRPVVLVTGSSGFIGRAVVERLALKHQVVGLDVREPAAWPENAMFLHADLTADRSVAGAMNELCERAGSRLASVVHLAAHVDFTGEPDERYEQVTVQGTRRLLEHLRAFDLQQFIFASTMLVHRPCQLGERIDEGWPVEPTWPYPQSKLRTEQLLRERHGETPLVTLRIAGVYDDLCHSLPLSHQIQRIFERRLTGQVFPGNIHHGQAMLHLADLTDAMARVVDQRAELPGQSVLLLGEPDVLSYDELQRTIARHLHHEDWQTHEIPKSLAKAGAWVQGRVPVGEEPFIKPWMIDRADDHYALDVTRAMRWLAWQPHQRLQSVLPKMLSALKEDPVGWYREHKLEMPGWLEESAHVRAPR